MVWHRWLGGWLGCVLHSIASSTVDAAVYQLPITSKSVSQSVLVCVFPEMHVRMSFLFFDTLGAAFHSAADTAATSRGAPTGPLTILRGHSVTPKARPKALVVAGPVRLEARLGRHSAPDPTPQPRESRGSAKSGHSKKASE